MMVVTMLVMGASGAGASNQAPAPADQPIPSSVQVDPALGIESKGELDKYLLSDEPKALTVSSAGELLTVKASEPVFSTMIAEGNCAIGRACLSGNPPVASHGFYGAAGTRNGSWSNKNKWFTGNYTAKAWYQQSGTLVGFGPTLGPNSTVTLTSPVTVVRVTIY